MIENENAVFCLEEFDLYRFSLLRNEEEFVKELRRRFPEKAVYFFPSDHRRIYKLEENELVPAGEQDVERIVRSKEGRVAITYHLSQLCRAGLEEVVVRHGGKEKHKG